MGNKFQRYMQDHPLVYVMMMLIIIVIGVAIRCWIGGQPLIRFSFLD